MKQVEGRKYKMESVRCNLCGENDFETVCFYNDIRIVRCRDCGLVCRNPRLKENMNREFYSFDYYGEYKGIEERISGARLELFKKALPCLKRINGPGPKRLLDVGCGQGHFLKLAKDDGWQVEGVELAKSACDYAKEKFGIDILNKSIEEANFSENSFDTLTMWNVLDHLLDPLAVLTEIYRILKPGGVLVIRVPNVSFHLFIHKILKNRRSNDPSVIVNYGFSGRTLRKILETAGFKGAAVYNSALSFGDPYNSLKSFSDRSVNLAKICLNIVSQAVFFATFGRLCVSSSLIARAVKKDG